VNVEFKYEGFTKPDMGSRQDAKALRNPLDNKKALRLKGRGF